MDELAELKVFDAAPVPNHARCQPSPTNKCECGSGGLISALGWGASATRCAALQHDGQHHAPASPRSLMTTTLCTPAPGDVLNCWCRRGPWWHSRSRGSHDNSEREHLVLSSSQQVTPQLSLMPTCDRACQPALWQHAHLVT